jgi:hypothetical protein
MNCVTVATFNETAQAEPLKRRLQESKIPAEIRQEHVLKWLWFVAKSAAGVRLKVPSPDYENALRLLRAWDAAEGALRHAIRCPECGSSRIEYPQLTRKFFLPNLIGLLSGLGLLGKEFYCEDCHFTWPTEGHRHSRARPHMAPYYFIEGIPRPDLDPNKPERETSSPRPD